MDPADILAAYTQAFADDPGPPEPAPDEPQMRNGHHLPGAEKVAAHQRFPALDWQRVFTGAAPDIDWLVPEFIARGQSYSLVSQAKEGKSLLIQDACAAISCGRSALGQPAQAPANVLYVDWENTLDDLVERYRDMGYQPEDLSRLRYL